MGIKHKIARVRNYACGGGRCRNTEYSVSPQTCPPMAEAPLGEAAQRKTDTLLFTPQPAGSNPGAKEEKKTQPMFYLDVVAPPTYNSNMVILYTKHAKLRIKQRELSLKQIEETVKRPDKILPSFKNRQLLRKDFSGKTLEIALVREKTDIVILTAYWLKEL